MTEKEPYVYCPLEELSVLVGDYSQNVYECSYNEDWVRSAWNRLGLNSDALDHLGREGLWVRWPEVEPGKGEKSDIQKWMDDLVRKAGAWPEGWLYPPTALTAEEKKRVGLPLLCHGDIMISLIQKYEHLENYHPNQITRIFYKVWDIVCGTIRKVCGENHPIDLTCESTRNNLIYYFEGYSEFLELQEVYDKYQKEQVEAEKTESGENLPPVSSTVKVEFTERFGTSFGRFVKAWVHSNFMYDKKGHDDPSKLH